MARPSTPDPAGTANTTSAATEQPPGADARARSLALNLIVSLSIPLALFLTLIKHRPELVLLADGPTGYRLSLTLPFPLYGIFRYLYLVHQKEGGGTPPDTLLADELLLRLRRDLGSGGRPHHLWSAADDSVGPMSRRLQAGSWKLKK